MNKFIVSPSLRSPTKENADYRNNVLVITARGILTTWQYYIVGGSKHIKYWIDVVPEYISVEERLPKHHEWVISCNKDTGIYKPDFYDEEQKKWNSEPRSLFSCISHWIPVPEEVIDFIKKEVSQ